MDFISFAQINGLLIRDLAIGRISRCSTENHPRSKNGAYLFNGEWGWVQDHAVHPEVQYWQDKKERTPFEMADVQKRIDASKKAYAQEREEGQRKAANKAKWILSQCELDIHAYADAKGFPDMRMNVWRKNDNAPLLVIPMFYKRQICGCQLIGIDGSKKFLTGQRTNDASFIFDAKGPVFLCEGWATGVSLRAVLAALKLPYTIHACFSAGNLGRMAKAFPDALILADNDVSQTGQKVAIESGNRWWMPDAVGADFNDFYKEMGLFKSSQIVRKQLLELRKK